MKKNTTHHFHKTLRKFRSIQQRLDHVHAPDAIRQLTRKLDLIRRRLLRLNRTWKLGIATAALMAWMAGPLQAQNFPAQLNLDTLSSDIGFVINGIDEEDRSGFSVSSAGDVNGDGLDDLIIVASGAVPNGSIDAGESYVVFGNMVSRDSLNLTDLDGTRGFVINGIDAGDYSGRSVSSAGDVNGDGIDDLIIGADRADPNGNTDAGESYVVFGSMVSRDSLNLSDLDGTNGFVINGIDAFDRAGRSVSSAGDVNGDGIHDLIIGASSADPNGNRNAGESYVVFGSTSTRSSLNLADLDGTNGFVINGIDEGGFSGGSVSSAGDVNGDGLDDLIIAASGAAPNGSIDAGESYVVFGNMVSRDSLNLSDLDGTNGFVINGIDAYDFSGRSLSSAGDVNGDGIDDLMIGADGAASNGNSDTGESYVVFGSMASRDSINLADLDGTNGFVINGIDVGDYSGRSLSSAGDVNGDGIDDLIIGASLADPNGNRNAGESYVVFGSRAALDSLNLSDLDGNNGFVINGIDANDRSGGSVSSAGDVNGDGIDDLIIGAYLADPNGNTRGGESYVIYGRKLNTSIDALTPSLSLEVAPNPSSGIVHVHAPQLAQASEATIELFDLQGKKIDITAQRISSKQFQLDLSDLPQGVYLLRLTADGEVGTAKVVKE